MDEQLYPMIMHGVITYPCPNTDAGLPGLFNSYDQEKNTWNQSLQQVVVK